MYMGLVSHWQNALLVYRIWAYQERRFEIFALGGDTEYITYDQDGLKMRHFCHEMFYDLDNRKNELHCYNADEMWSLKATYTWIVAVLTLAECTEFFLPYSAQVLHWLHAKEYEPE
jgi:hypothetical protein